MIKKIVSRLRNQFLKVKYRKNAVIIMGNVKFNSKSTFKGYSRICKNAQLNDTYVGLGTYVGWNSILHNCKIGNFCSIAPYVEVIYGRHPVKFVSTHPAFFSLRKQSGFTFATEQKYKEQRLVEDQYSAVIGNDVWIGYGASILEGVKIGDGAIIGARALVTKDVEPYSINIGVPAKTIGYRFDEKYRDFLLKFRWWDRDYSWLQENHGLFDNMEEFYETFHSDVERINGLYLAGNER